MWTPDLDKYTFWYQMNLKKQQISQTGTPEVQRLSTSTYKARDAGLRMTAV